MKRKLSVLLAIIIIVSSLCSCSSGDESVELTILMDDAMMLSTGKVGFEESFQEAVDYLNPDQNIILRFDYLKKDAIERETQLSRVRTEIMAGNGPDIFILPTWESKLLMLDNGPQPRSEPLFKDIEDSMRNGVFLPLDDYIENSKYLDLDEHIEIIMEAGRTDEGQVLLPYTFEYGLYLLDVNKISSTDTTFDNIYDLVHAQDDTLKDGLAFFSTDWIHGAFPNYVDYDDETLIITEAELASVLKDVSEIFGNVESSWEGPFHEVTAGASIQEFMLLQWDAIYQEVLPVVVPNSDGGITATVTSFVAINRNTKHPQEAFNVIAPMFSEEMQEINSNIWVEELECNIGFGISDCTDIGVQRGIVTNKNVYNEANYYACWEDLVSIHDRITDVRFMSEMDCMLYDAWNEISVLFFEGRKDQVNFDAIAAELYSDWKMMVAE